LDATGLAPITVAARRLGRSPWTLKRWYRKGNLPVVISEGQWSVPESFLAMVDASPRPGQAGVIEDIAAAWFAAHTAPEAAAS
jgi:hypothetical protein